MRSCAATILWTACKSTQVSSLDFIINRFFVKLFRSIDKKIVKACQKFFCIELRSVQLCKRVKIQKLRVCAIKIPT